MKGRAEYKLDKKYLSGILGAVAALLLFWMWTGSLKEAEHAEAYVTITAFSVGKADALLLLCGDTAVLVDAGEEDDGPEILRELRKRGVSRLDLLLITHFDKDHVGGASYLMDQLDIASVMMPDYEGERPEYEAFVRRLQGHPNVRRPDAQVQFSTGALEWTVWPAENPEQFQDGEKEYDNDLSLVAQAVYGESRFLLTGDIEKARIRQMLDTGTDWSCDWIKMPHHGRYEKAQEELLDAAQPSFAVICCSEKNPAEEKTLKMLERRGITCLDTSKSPVETVCDGKQIVMQNTTESGRVRILRPAEKRKSFG